MNGDIDTVVRAIDTLARLMQIDVGDLTTRDIRALTAIGESEPVSTGAVSMSVGIPSSSATRLFDRLVARDLIERLADPSDRRGVLLRLLPQGRELVTRLQAQQREAISSYLATFPDAGRERIAAAFTTFAHAAEVDATEQSADDEAVA